MVRDICAIYLSSETVLNNRYRARQSDLRYTANSQLESLHSRYTGTGESEPSLRLRVNRMLMVRLSLSGHADVTKHEWLVHQHRDTYA
jgi:splicing factor 3B subunit 5